MPWNDIARAQHTRKTDRYPSDMSDDEWSLVEPMIPPARSGGRPRTTDMREVMNAIFYIGSTGCQWRALPTDFPPMTTVQGYFYKAQFANCVHEVPIAVARQDLADDFSRSHRSNHRR